MKIHELAQKTGLTPSAIRYYEKVGLLDLRHVRRGENNYRYYGEETVEHLQLIIKAQSVGFTILELKEVVQAEETSELPLPMMIDLLHRKIKEIDRRQSELDQVKVHLARILAHKMALLNAEK
ncbi:MerR family transcriptional regulator [Paenibacillus sp. AR247]|uniref:MerR family transcriptional regulator n=1 Tax=Paenibacillus sp. AR247 TaxID=1631599 RepID=UPI000CF97002|nr:MerR family transcriptional regulator [Paenibacillus sp. AR247]PQP88672.1 MerR family transcriptional regulator [Paenibacillus sp. AR247]